jgi:hypothetical protein
MAFLGPIGLKILVGALILGLVVALYLRWRGAQRAIGAAIEVAEQKAHNSAVKAVQDAIKPPDPGDPDGILARL